MSDKTIEEAEVPVFGQVLALAGPEERPSEVRVFEMKGKKYRFEIYTDGRDDAELWTKLLAASSYGFTLQSAAKYTGQEFTGITEAYPVGQTIKQITIKDAGYIGAMRVLMLCLKSPAWSWTECLIMGHQLGKGIADVAQWASDANGVTESYLVQLADFQKKMKKLTASAN